MKAKAVLSTILVLILSAAGYMLRRWALVSSFEDYDLMIPGARPPLIFCAFLFAAAIVLLICSTGKVRSPENYADAMGSRSVLYLLVSLITGFVMIGAGAMGFYELYLSFKLNNIVIILPVFCVLAGFAWIVMSASAWRGKSGTGLGVWAFFPVLMLCIMVVMLYREVAAMPSLFMYMMTILAPCAAAIAFYYGAGFIFGIAKTRRCLFATRLAAMLSIIALADPAETSRVLILAFLALAMLVNNFCLTASSPRIRGKHE